MGRGILLATLRKPPAEPDTAELARAFEEHHARVYRAAYRITGSTSDAEDVLQSVFLRLARLDRSPATIDNLASYLYRAAINSALDVCRSRWQTDRVAGEDPGGGADRATPPGELVEMRAWLRRALTTVSPRQAEMFVLRYLEGYDNREIAQMLGTSEAVVAVSLFRARAQLQRQFRKLSGGGR
jgi:RNA polymerase sigma factor (sigma-70 family)